MEGIYTTIAAPGTGEFKDRGSRFIGFAYPIKHVDDVKHQVATLKKLHPKAVHHCFAYRLGIDGLQFRANDDGEPSGSAGKPMLGQLDSNGLTNVLVVVVRYFGGTLLGVPGLINAYRQAVAAALADTHFVEKELEHEFEIEFDYPLIGDVLQCLKQAGATVLQKDFQLFCRATVSIPVSASKTVVLKLGEMRGVKIAAKRE
jgi:uncharacterized YigZ family protein